MNALVMAGAEVLESAGLAIPGVDIISGILLTGTALYMLKEGSSPQGSSATPNEIESEIVQQGQASLLSGAQSGSCDTDQECCLEDGTADPQDQPGPTDSGSDLPEFDVSVFIEPTEAQQSAFAVFQDGVKALNTETGEIMTLRYRVYGRLTRVGTTLSVSSIDVWPLIDGSAHHAQLPISAGTSEHEGDDGRRREALGVTVLVGRETRHQPLPRDGRLPRSIVPPKRVRPDSPSLIDGARMREMSRAKGRDFRRPRAFGFRGLPGPLPLLRGLSRRRSSR